MTIAASIEQDLPVWADYVWLARGDRSRLYRVIRNFLQSLEAAAASISAEAVEEFRRRRHGQLLCARAKYLLCALCGLLAKRDRYGGKIANERRAIRDAAITLGAGQLNRGELSQIMNRWGSDKASGHNYPVLYEHLLQENRERIARVFEAGIGSNHLDVPSNMGTGGRPGASLRGWREYFSNAVIFGADIDKRILFEEDRIKTAFVDQYSPDTVERLFSSLGGTFDLIIDDGCHEVNASRIFFEGAFARLKDDGLYVIEDVPSRNRRLYRDLLGRFDAAIVDIPYERNHNDNCLAIIAKDGEVDR